MSRMLVSPPLRSRTPMSTTSALRELQQLLAVITGACHTCDQTTEPCKPVRT